MEAASNLREAHGDCQGLDQAVCSLDELARHELHALLVDDVKQQPDADVAVRETEDDASMRNYSCAGREWRAGGACI